MKLICLFVSLACLGTGWSLTGPAASGTPAPCAPTEACQPTVRPTGNGTCIVECEGPDGRTCRLEIACEGDTCVVKSCERGGPDCCPTSSEDA